LNLQLNDRWHGVERPYTEAEAARLRGSVKIEYSLARLGAEKFWRLLHSETCRSGFGLHDRQPSNSNGASRTKGHLLLRVASCR
jgi:isocitrate lyase